MGIPWWRDAVVYEIYVRSFADASGDGVGDLPGVRSRLPYLARLGVDAIWLTPFYPSPMADGGYDVADYRDVDPRFGSLDDFDALVADAHRLGLRVLVDIVPNHSSAEHPWLKAALAAGPGSPERERYIFADSGDGPPDDWQSTFGRRAGQPRTGAVHLGRRRGRTAHQLAVVLHRPGMGTRARWAAVPPAVRSRTARLQLAQSGGARRVHRHAALLAGAGSGRLPHRRGHGVVQGRRAAGRATGRAELHVRLPHLGASGGARGLSDLAQATGLLPRRTDGGRRGMDRLGRGPRPLRAPGRAASELQLRVAAGPLVGHGLPRGDR